MLECRAWHSDAILVAIMTREQLLPGIYKLPFETVDAQEVLILPDISHADGEAPSWTFLCYSRSANKEITVTVYAAAIVVRGQEIIPRYTPEHYWDLGHFGPYLDSIAVAGALPSNGLGWAMAIERPRPEGGIWRFAYNIDDSTKDSWYFSINAKSGQLEGCNPESYC